MKRLLIAFTSVLLALLAATAATPAARSAPGPTNTIHLLGFHDPSGAGNGGKDVDAVINRVAKTITIVQRNIPRGQSQLTVGWINTNIGRSGISRLTGWAERTVPIPPYCAQGIGMPDQCFPGSSYRVTDATAVLPTGSGNIAVGITGLLPRLPSCLVPVLPECYGLFFPGGWVLPV